MTEPGRLSDRIALITGASRGIGAAVAKRFAAEGAHLVLCARTVGGLEEVDDAVKEISGTRATLVPLDLTDGDAVDQLGGAIHERFGRLDILVGNAGILGELSPVGHIEPKVWDDTFAINCTTNFRLIRSMDPLLRASEAGRALFVTSGATRNLRPFWAAYAASKAALEAMVTIYA
ncbi:MAG: SDR family NAD(P)-dependent oxidoreductase, partial [Proteobacteria bacterium]|nr:SDR family NAD(P)-dependent oxidoreductase [Pseudomonadota bacterium]